MKIRIFQPIVPEYRVALFEGLAERYGDNIEIFAAEGLGQDKSYPLKKMRYDYSHSFRRIGPFLWQTGLSLKGLSRGDVAVVCGDVHQLSSLWIAFKAKCCGIKVVWWGHHVSAQAKESRVGIRLRIAKCLSDVFLCYTDTGIGFLESRGFKKGRVFATGNTIDLDAVEKATKEWTGERIAEFKNEHGLSGKRVLVFCGVLREKVRADVLLQAFSKVVKSIDDLHLVIIGGGTMLETWKQLSSNLGLDSYVTWTGEIRGQDKLAPWFLSSGLFVYPGRIGLSIIHAFSFGLPVVLNDNKSNHGPEYVAFAPGENGYAFHENDADDLANKIIKALDDGERTAKGEAGKRFVFEHYSMKNMVARYSEAIEAAVNLK